jgi:hypothetical protein
MIRLARARSCPSDRSSAVTATMPANMTARGPVSGHRIRSHIGNWEAPRP